MSRRACDGCKWGVFALRGPIRLCDYGICTYCACDAGVTPYAIRHTKMYASEAAERIVHEEFVCKHWEREEDGER